MASEGVDAYFGIRSEHMRYLTGFALDDGEDRLAGNSGRFLVSGQEVVIFADSRYRLQAIAQTAGARIEPTTHDLAAAWPHAVASLGARRVAVESAAISHELWIELEVAAPTSSIVCNAAELSIANAKLSWPGGSLCAPVACWTWSEAMPSSVPFTPLQP